MNNPVVLIVKLFFILFLLSCNNKGKECIIDLENNIDKLKGELENSKILADKKIEDNSNKWKLF